MHEQRREEEAYFLRVWRLRTCLRALGVLLLALTLGCTGVPRTSPRGTPTKQPPAVAATRPAAPPPAPDANLSGALDGRTLRLALYDLAIIFDTIGRLEQIEPRLKSQMLAELAEADAATAAVVVKRWRERLVELKQAEDDLRLVSAERQAEPSPRAPPRDARGAAPDVSAPAARPDARGLSPSHPVARPTGIATDYRNAPRPTELQPARGVEIPPDPGVAERSAISGQQSADGDHDSPLTTHHSPGLPWDEQVRTLLGEARERARDSDPDDRRTRIQLALLELLWQTEQNRNEAKPSDAELWNQIAPAVRSALGAGPHDGQAAAGALDAVATERLRGPARLEARNVAFCRRVRGFGNIERAEPGAFQPGQPVLVYNEVENLLGESVPDGFRSRLSSELELLNAQRETVWHQQFAAVDDHSSVVRRDYFLSHSFRLPATLKPGEYSLRITLHDELAKRSTSAAIPLVVR